MFLFSTSLDQQLNALLTPQFYLGLDEIIEKEQSQQPCTPAEEKYKDLANLHVYRIETFGFNGEVTRPAIESCKDYAERLDNMQSHCNTNCYRTFTRELLEAFKENRTFSRYLKLKCMRAHVNINAFIDGNCSITDKNKCSVRSFLAGLMVLIAHLDSSFDLKGYDRKLWDLLKQDHLDITKK